MKENILLQKNIKPIAELKENNKEIITQ